MVEVKAFLWSLLLPRLGSGLLLPVTAASEAQCTARETGPSTHWDVTRLFVELFYLHA